MAQHSGEARRHSFDRSSRAQPTHHPQPCPNGLGQQRSLAVNQRFLLHGDPKIGRVAAQRFAEKSRGSHSDDRERVALNDEIRAHNLWIAAVTDLPGAMAEHGNRRCARPVVISVKHAPTECAYAEHGKVISGDVLGVQGFGGLFAFAPHAQEPVAGLESSHVLKFRCLRFQPFIQWERIESPTVLRAAFHTAFVALAHAVEPPGIRNRQGAQHHRMNQREYRRGSADSQGERQHGRGRENRRPPELSHRVAKIADELWHDGPPDSVTKVSYAGFRKIRNFFTHAWQFGTIPV